MAPDNEIVEQISEHLAEIMKLLEKELNLENLSTHSLRKTFAYHLYMQKNIGLIWFNQTKVLLLKLETN